MNEVWLNGGFVARDDARVSAFDAGFQHGVGLFETMRAGLRDAEPFVFQLEEHLARLERSATALGLAGTLRTGPLGDAVLSAVARAGHDAARVRLTITGGDLNLLRAGASRHDPTIFIDVQPATAYPDRMFEQGVVVAIADAKANPLNPIEGHKTLNYWWRLRELQTAGAKGAAEALVFAASNHLAGGCVSNALIVKDGTLITPIARTEEQDVGGKGAMPSPVLPGTTRAWALAQAVDMGLGIQRRMVTIEDVLDAEELMLTNSSWGVLPVVRVERKEIGSGAVGEVARTLRADWLRAMSSSAGD